MKQSSRLRLDTAVRFFDHVRSESACDTRWMVTDGRGDGDPIASLDLAGLRMSCGTLPAGIYDSRVTSDAYVVTLSLQDRPSIVFNGFEVEGAVVAVGRRDACCRAHWSTGSDLAPGVSIAKLLIPNSWADPTWPGEERFFPQLSVAPAAFARLRSLIHGALVVASSMPEAYDDSAALTGARDNILERLGEVIRSARRRDPPRLTRDYLDLAWETDRYLDANQSRPIYSAEVAQTLGVAQRTLHTVMMQINGIPLHRYIRLRRLQSVRRALVEAEPGSMVKQFALDAGFRHLGRFAAEYFHQFGEAPSDTLARRV